MSVLVDSSIWSEVFRYSKAVSSNRHSRLKDFIKQGQVKVIGPIRQEILSGISVQKEFDALREYLSFFPDEEMVSSDYNLAAEMYNTCRARGIQGSHTDFLICAVSCRLSLSIYTSDKDFKRYAKHLPIELLLEK